MKKTFYAVLFVVAFVAVSLVAIQDPMRPSDYPMVEMVGQ